MKNGTKRSWIPLVILILAMLACNFPTPTPLVTPEETKIADGTPGVAPSQDTPSAQTPEVPGPTPTEAPAVESEDGCTFKAAYVADVTVPDDTVMDKNETFVKTWRLRNSGTCPWEAGTKFVYISGDVIGGPPSISVAETQPNAQVDLSVNMTAPDKAGTYRSNWQLESPDGKRYGGVFYVQILVEGDPTPTPTLTVTPTPTATNSTPPTNFSGAVATDCSKVNFTWSDGKGENAYRLEGPGLTINLAADSTAYTWNNPPAGGSVVTLIALDKNNGEIGRISATVNLGCGVSDKPDLIVESVTFNPSTPVAYLPLSATIKIKNLGGVDSGAFKLRWWGGANFSSVSCEWNVSAGLEAGESTSLTCSGYTFSSNYASLNTKAQIDVDNSVTEANEANNIYERSISVISPKSVYDFIEKAPTGVWQAGDPWTDLTWNGDSSDNSGFALWATGKLENGSNIQGKCLETHPRWVNNGWIKGTYIDLYHSGYTIQKGDSFYATVGFLQNAAAGKGIFKVTLRVEDLGSYTIAETSDSYDNSIKTILVDLSEYAGHRADMILQFDAGDSAEQDWACWTRANIYRYP